MKIAIIDDQSEIRYSVSKILKRVGHDTLLLSGLEFNIIKQIQKSNIDLLVVDVMLSDDFSGIDLVKNLIRQGIKLPVILMTAYTTPTNMIEASKIGIKDILQKPFTPDELKNMIKKYDEKNEDDIKIIDQINEEFVGSFETMKDIYNKIGVASTNDLPVMILGDTGTGKELIANLIHKNSKFAKSDILAVNCATIPSELFESQFFGHEKGSFSGAKEKHIGFAEAVGEGTLFLDEIGEIDISLQSKLLRFLENKTFKRVGGNKDIKFKGRIISATNINLRENIENKTFREDLYFRLSTIKIEVPSLEERKEDIPILAQFFIKQANKELNLNIKGISNDAMELLKSRHYKGNIRELKNSIYNSALNAHEDIIKKEDIHFENKQKRSSNISDAIKILIAEKGIENAQSIFNQIEKEFYKELLNECDNITHLSNYLGISRSTLRKILHKHKLQQNSRNNNDNSV